MTPLSSVHDISSRGSVGDDGYDGDSSDGEEDGASIMSFSADARSRCPLLPDFWLVVKLDHDVVHVYFHTRFDFHACNYLYIVCVK